jgi:hypothetical protein
VVVSAVQHVSIEPIDGWGFFERDQVLRPRFEADVSEVGAGPLVYDHGWSGFAESSSHPYSGKHVLMTPRHVEWDGVVVLHVHDDDKMAEDGMVFSGMAVTANLECSWK